MAKMNLRCNYDNYNDFSKIVILFHQHIFQRVLQVRPAPLKVSRRRFGDYRGRMFVEQMFFCCQTNRVKDLNGLITTIINGIYSGLSLRKTTFYS